MNRQNIFQKTVVSSAYWVIFVDLFGSIWTPSIYLERLIALLRISTPITKRIPESGQPCLTPPLRLKGLVAKPLFRTQLDMLLYKTVIHCRNWGPHQFKSFKAFWKVAPFNRIESFFEIKKDCSAWNVFLFSKGQGLGLLLVLFFPISTRNVEETFASVSFFLRFVVFTLPSQIGLDSCFFQMFSIQYFILDPKTFRFFLLSLILGHQMCWRKAKRSPDGL